MFYDATGATVGPSLYLEHDGAVWSIDPESGDAVALELHTFFDAPGCSGTEYLATARVSAGLALDVDGVYRVRDRTTLAVIRESASLVINGACTPLNSLRESVPLSSVRQITRPARRFTGPISAVIDPAR